ncbi:hypothetical protein QJQ45_022932 [Haematococcus lacustris]|nr:hypothetical protein QJQ45_022932 [Haematococcus lacustris]
MPGPKKRTIIVNGEIYSGEDDPRYIAYLQRRAGASGSHRSEVRPPQGTPAPQGPGTMSTPPLRLSTGPPGWLGLPDVEVFGTRIPALLLLVLLLVGYKYGWRSAVAALMLWYAYKVPDPGPKQGQAGATVRARARVKTSQPSEGGSTTTTTITASIITTTINMVATSIALSGGLWVNTTPSTQSQGHPAAPAASGSPAAMLGDLMGSLGLGTSGAARSSQDLQPGPGPGQPSGHPLAGGAAWGAPASTGPAMQGSGTAVRVGGGVGEARADAQGQGRAFAGQGHRLGGS